MMTKKDTIIIALCTIFSIISGIVSKDIVMGGSILLTGLLCAYFASIGKRVNYILGFINYILMGVVAFKNNLYGIFFFYLIIFSPLQIQGFVTWNKNLKKDQSVKVREFTLKNSLLITISCILGSLILGYLLTLVPGQKYSFLDASSNCVNLCGIILMILRFKESWWLWLLNNIIDLAIWALTFLNNGEGSAMMLLVSIGYLLINIYGIIKWNKEAKQSS